ncbi:MAG TPA: hypothetical protein VL484_07755 [Vicinamibacterales bacterium]|jgi:hypothetical protein|nr:hypothetical protein [Vicinamibacterales bacterium]
MLFALLLSLFVQAGVLPAQPSPAVRASDSLEATIRIAFAKTGTMAGDAGPYAAFGPILVQMLTPEGPAEIRYTVSEDAMRAELVGRVGPLPRGTVVLQRVGETTMQVLNPEQKTWYAVSSEQTLGLLLGTPDIDIQPTGEHATIAGERADRFHFSETLHVPAPEGVSLPPDFPRDVQFTGELWSTTALAGDRYAAVLKTMQTFAAIPGIDALTAGGRFPLRMTLGSDLLGGYVLQTEVTSLRTTTTDRTKFMVPSDYQRVEPPFGKVARD